ncbi:hypothetical protein [Verrucomicrobium sp. BvORR106]|uniref:hypothetical protein n=1 Tax=Verrucomicrobium sp. BvORR106 TaxID=1403819 RepID=UPI0005704CF8|nr:hypothetical protein [Verrucomicrobium sp. BvORR106]
MWRWTQSFLNTRSRKLWASLAVLALGITLTLRPWSGTSTPTSTRLPAIARPEKDAPWKKALWEKVLVAENALLQRREYLLTDPEFLAPLDARLDELYFQLRHAPNSEAERASFQKTLQEAYLEAQRSPDGIARLERHLAHIFSHPSISRDDAASSITADYGIVPGKLASPANASSARSFVITKSELLDDHRLPQSSFVAAKLEELARQHPQAREILVRICPLHDEKAAFCEYRYQRELGNNQSMTGLLTVSPPTEKRSHFYREWSHAVHGDQFTRWTQGGYSLHQSLRDQTSNALAGALLEMDVNLVLTIHAPEAQGSPVWRPDSGEIAIRTSGAKWTSIALQHVPRLFPKDWEGHTIAVWPPGEVESSQLAEKASQWEAGSKPESRGETSVVSANGTRYEWRQSAAGSRSPSRSQTELVRITPDGRSEVLLHGGAGCHHPALSPDEAWLAFVDHGKGVLVYRLAESGGGSERAAEGGDTGK